MLIELFKNNLAKSTGRLSLFEHALGTARVAAFILEKFAPEDYPEQKQNLLLFSAFTHDLGKLDPNFQLMLQAAAEGQPFPGKRVKHEASTLEYADLLAEASGEVIDFLARETGRRIKEVDPLLVTASLFLPVSHEGYSTDTYIGKIELLGTTRAEFIARKQKGMERRAHMALFRELMAVKSGESRDSAFNKIFSRACCIPDELCLACWNCSLFGGLEAGENRKVHGIPGQSVNSVD